MRASITRRAELCSKASIAHTPWSSRWAARRKAARRKAARRSESVEAGETMAKHAVPKTNAMRALDARRIPYAVFTYPDSIHSADEVAVILGVPARVVYKTLVVFADGERRLLVMAPGDRELD